MRITNVFIFLILLIAVACDTESSFPIPEENYFVKFYGEEGEQEGVDFALNSDGSVVMVGNSWTREDKSDQQIYIVKVDANGNLIWQKKIGLPDKRDLAKDVELHTDGRIVIAGETEMNPDDKDFYIKILSPDGNDLDSARDELKIGVVSNDEVNSVTIISNGFMIAGATTLLESGAPSPNDQRDAMHLRFSNSLHRIGELSGAWSEVTGTSNSDDFATKIIEVDPNVLYYVFGSSNEDKGDNTSDYDFWVFGLGHDGGLYPGPGPEPFPGEPLYFGSSTEDELLKSVGSGSPQSVSSYVLNGISSRSSGFSQTYIVQITKAISLGRIKKLVEVKPTDIGSNVESASMVIGRINNNYLLISDDYNLPNSGSNISLQSLDNEFSKESNAPIILGGEGDDFTGSVAELPDGRILLVGTMTVGQSSTKGQKKMVLIKLNPNGKLSE